MKWSDIRPGVLVYHSLYTHWGKGVVFRIAHVDALTAMFERGTTQRVLVKFEEHDEATLVTLQMLRKTPNRKKIREMVAMYQKRGVGAKDGGDRLVLPIDAAD